MVSRARKRKIAATPTRTFEWGGSAPTKQAMAEAKAEMERRLLARYPTRLGPIEWRVYDGAQAEEMLTAAGMPQGKSEAADGLRGFIAETSGAQLIVGSVLVRRDAIRV